MGAAVRAYVTDPICLEAEGGILGQAALPGLQGTVVLAVLVLERHRGLSRSELAEELWGGHVPPGWDGTLRSILSKLRSSLETIGLERGTLAQAFGHYQLRLPPSGWVDVEAAFDGVHRAEAALGNGSPREACGWALVAATIARRPFLPGAEGRLVSHWRGVLQDVRVRALDCLAEVWILTGQPQLAVRDAASALQLEPFRESSYRLMMRAHASAGNRAEALRVYERCRMLLAEELGVPPSPETERVYLEILRA